MQIFNLDESSGGDSVTSTQHPQLKKKTLIRGKWKEKQLNHPIKSDAINRDSASWGLPAG